MIFFPPEDYPCFPSFISLISHTFATEGSGGGFLFKPICRCCELLDCSSVDNSYKSIHVPLFVDVYYGMSHKPVWLKNINFLEFL